MTRTIESIVTRQEKNEDIYNDLEKKLNTTYSFLLFRSVCSLVYNTKKQEVAVFSQEHISQVLEKTGAQLRMVTLFIISRY